MIRLRAESRNKLDGHAAVVNGDDVADTGSVGANCAFDNVQASGGIRDGSTGGRGTGGELGNDIKSLGVHHV